MHTTPLSHSRSTCHQIKQKETIMTDLAWYDYLQEQEEYNPFSADELPRQVLEAYDDNQDWEEAA